MMRQRFKPSNPFDMLFANLLLAVGLSAGFLMIAGPKYHVATIICNFDLVLGVAFAAIVSYLTFAIVKNIVIDFLAFWLLGLFLGLIIGAF